MVQMKVILVIVVILSGSFAGAQQLRPGGLDRFRNEITLEKAAQSVARYLMILNKRDPGRGRYVGQIRGYDTVGRFWSIYDNPITFRIGIDTVTGQMVSYYNSSRAMNQFRQRGRTGRNRFSEAHAARSYLRYVARKLGVPEAAELRDFVLKADGQVRDANSTGYIGACFYEHGNQVATLSCDVQDGTVLSFTRRLR